MDTFTASGRIIKKRTAIWTMIDRCFLFLAQAWDLHQRNCFANCLRWLLNMESMEAKHQKQHVVWTAPFWSTTDTFTASHGKNKLIDPHLYFLMICERWNVLIFTFWFPHFFLKKQTEKSSPKTNIEEKTSKTKCCLNSTLLNHSGHFYSIPWKNELIDPHLFLQMTCDMWEKLWSSQFSFSIFFQESQIEKSSPKTNMEKKHQKQHREGDKLGGWHDYLHSVPWPCLLIS